MLQKLFPPIPHMKDPITDNLQNSKLVRLGSCWGWGWDGADTALPGEQDARVWIRAGGRGSCGVTVTPGAAGSPPSAPAGVQGLEPR